MVSLCEDMKEALPVIAEDEDIPILTTADMDSTSFDEEIVKAVEMYFEFQRFEGLSAACVMLLYIRLEFAIWELGELEVWHPEWIQSREETIVEVASTLTDMWHLNCPMWILCTIGGDRLLGGRSFAHHHPSKERLPVCVSLTKKYFGE